MMIKLNIAERETDRETETDRDSLAHSLTLMWMDGWMTPVWICIFDMGTKTHWLTHENGKAFLWIGSEASSRPERLANVLPPRQLQPKAASHRALLSRQGSAFSAAT